ncbi:alpha/beta hydrolase fold-domain-containing protein [Cladorrhinum sp. PSN332]|nr:alpha/beta hydrolase fold-domain-containing protein [Cladorrhinum sp. PSN332]
MSFFTQQPSAPRPTDKEDNDDTGNLRIMLAMIPHLPLMVRTAIFHMLGTTKQSKYLDLRTEMVVNLLRAFINPSTPKSISSTQKMLNKWPPIKGKIWVANYTLPFSLPPTDTESIQTLVSQVIDELSPTGKSLRHAYTMPSVDSISAEWTGYRHGATTSSPLPSDLSQRALYEEMMKDVTSPITVLYFHGGAYWLMDPASHRPTTKSLARETGGRVFSVRYRLSPQNAFPAALIDALVSYLTLLYPPPGAFHEPVRPEHVVLAGDSAGGNLALSLLQFVLHLNRTEGTTPLIWNGHTLPRGGIPLPAGTALNSPWMDITHSSPSCAANAEFDYLPDPKILSAAEEKRPACKAWPTTPPRRHVYADDLLLNHPLVTVMLAPSWKGSPPVWMCTGWELLADEDRYVAQKMWKGGVTVRYEEYEGMPHCFGIIFPGLRASRRCLAGWGGFMKEVVEGKGTQGEGKSKFLVINPMTMVEREVGGGEVCKENTMDRHAQTVAKVASKIRTFFDAREPYRIFHGSTNSTRPRLNTKQIDISSLKNVLQVDVQRKIALVEPNVPMDRLVEATLPHGLVPPVVMEFPGITAGGGFAGTAGESSSFRHGFFDDTVNRVEMVMADGQVVNVSRQERGDLFRGAAGAVGTLGVTTLLEVQLMEAKKFVKTRYRRTRSVREAVEAVREEVGKEGNDYVDGILFSKEHGVVISGELTDAKPEGVREQTFSGAWDPWFYLHAKERTAAGKEGDVVEDYIPLAEYLFRYDRGGFWVGAAAFAYFKFVPFTRFFRWFLDDFLHTRMMYRALHGSGESARFVVQDIAMPFETTEKFVDYTADQLGIWPLWLCPLKRRGSPTFHPFTTLPEGVERKEEDMMLNVGVWGWGPSSPARFVQKNRELENKVRELGGMKWLYAHTYYPQEEFWPMYGGRQWYDGLREKYNAGHLPSVWDKVHVDPEAAGNKKRHWLKRIPPLGGFYGIYKSIQSKDYMLHRNATWKWEKED